MTTSAALNCAVVMSMLVKKVLNEIKYKGNVGEAYVMGTKMVYSQRNHIVLEAKQ